MSKIIKKNYTDIRVEGDAGGTITPGHLCKLASDGDYEVHNDVGGPAACLIALEDSYQGNEITDDYEAGDRVIMKHFTPGEQAQIIISGDSTTDVSIGDFLISAGDGTFKPQSHASVESIGETISFLAFAEEAGEGGDRITVTFI